MEKSHEQTDVEFFPISSSLAGLLIENFLEQGKVLKMPSLNVEIKKKEKSFGEKINKET